MWIGVAEPEEVYRESQGEKLRAWAFPGGWCVVAVVMFIAVVVHCVRREQKKARRGLHEAAASCNGKVPAERHRALA